MATHSSILAWRNPMDRGAWQATVHGGHEELSMTKWVSEAGVQATERELGLRLRFLLIQSPFLYRTSIPPHPPNFKFLILYWGRAD